MIEYITIRFNTGDEYVIDFNTITNEWVCSGIAGDSFPFLDQCIKAIYDDFNQLHTTQLRSISAEF